MKVLIGTNNPAKIEGAKRAFNRYFDDFEIEGVSVNSEVPDQPFDGEILQGAKNRVKNLKKYAIENKIEADYYIAIEAGITSSLGALIQMNIAVIEDKLGVQSVSTSQGFPVPERYIEEIKQTEFGKLMDRILNGDKLSKGKGGISILTKGQVSRIDITENAFIMALTTHINGNLWK